MALRTRGAVEAIQTPDDADVIRVESNADGVVRVGDIIRIDRPNWSVNWDQPNMDVARWPVDPYYVVVAIRYGNEP